MNPTELRKELKTRDVRTVNLKGREALLKAEARDVIVKALVTRGMEAFNVQTVRTDRLSDDDLTDIQSPPMESGKRVVVLMGGGDPEPILQSRGPDTVLLSWQGKFGFADVTVDCERLLGGKLRSWVKSRARGKGVDLDQDDIEKLVTAFGSDAAELAQQVEKLSLLDHVEGIHVTELCAAAGGAEVWEAVDAVFRCDRAETASLSHALLTSDTPPLVLIIALQKRCNLLAAQEVGAPLDVPDWEVERLKKRKGKSSWDELQRLFRRLILLEWRAKRGAGPEEIVTVLVNMADGRW